MKNTRKTTPRTAAKLTRTKYHWYLLKCEISLYSSHARCKIAVCRNSRETVVQLLHILRQPVDDAADGRCIMKGDGRSQDTLQGAVEPVKTEDRAFSDYKLDAQSSQRSNSHYERGADTCYEYRKAANQSAEGVDGTKRSVEGHVVALPKPAYGLSGEQSRCQISLPVFPTATSVFGAHPLQYPKNKVLRTDAA